MNRLLPLVRRRERRLWLKWVSANIAAMVVTVLAGFGALILALALEIVEPGEIASIPLVYTGIFGWFYAFLLGTTQWLVLRQKSFQYHTWVGTTVTGAILYSVVTSLVWSKYSGVWAAVALGALQGAAIGLAQWLLLRRRFSGAGWWIPATIAGYAIPSVLPEAPECQCLLFFLVPGALTGFVLVRLFRQPVEAVEIRPSSVSEAPPRLQVCPRCGAEVTSGAISCLHCERSLVNRPQAVQTSDKPAQEPIRIERQDHPRSLV